MPTTPELLRAQRQEQEIEEARSPLRSVNDARSVISNEQPSPNVNVSLEMCLLRMEESDLSWRLELINLADAPDFSDLLSEYSTLDFSRRSMYVFLLTVWKNLNDALNHLEYRQGFCYRFDKVHSLKLLFGNPVGSIQIRQRLRAEPLTNSQATNHNHGVLLSTAEAAAVAPQQTRNESSRVDDVGDALEAPLNHNQNGARQTPPQTLLSSNEGLLVPTPAIKS
ncbi:hypothetical protein PI124_g21804 [Phytophthora idaei]|nr:hypothetical protein PI125_g23662 [Phytophthora idaei]KAG3233119.1 hypothetical protein PI124_g21804 [Phytophthora idaei]